MIRWYWSKARRRLRCRRCGSWIPAGAWFWHAVQLAPVHRRSVGWVCRNCERHRFEFEGDLLRSLPDGCEARERSRG